MAPRRGYSRANRRRVRNLVETLARSTSDELPISRVQHDAREATANFYAANFREHLNDVEGEIQLERTTTTNPEVAKATINWVADVDNTHVRETKY